MLRVRIKPKSFLIQPMVKGDLELIAGVGPRSSVWACGHARTGGVRAEVYKDVAFRLAPLNQRTFSAWYRIWKDRFC